MVTYTLQWLIAVATLIFVYLALRIARPSVAPDPFYRSAWKLAGLTFAFDAASQVVQYAWGGMALWGGAGSGSMGSYLRWAPVLNHSRTFLSLCLGVGLVVLAMRAAPPGRWFWRVYLAGVVVAVGLSAAVGVAEGSLVESTHYLRVALWDTVELVVVLGALLVVLVADRVDRYLWAALATNGFSVALSVLWMAALSRVSDPFVWSPSPRHVAAYRLVLAAVMVALALRRLALARDGRRVGGLIAGAGRTARTSSSGIASSGARY